MRTENVVGGPAFPIEDRTLYRGMTLRDWFAGHFAGSLVTVMMDPATKIEGYTPGEEGSPYIAQAAYRLADAMLAEREKEPGG